MSHSKRTRSALIVLTVLVSAATSVAQTLPSHASLFTGFYPYEHGLLANRNERRMYVRAPGAVPVFLGVDGGSTSTKAVLLSQDGSVLGAVPIEPAVAGSYRGGFNSGTSSQSTLGPPGSNLTGRHAPFSEISFDGELEVLSHNLVNTLVALAPEFDPEDPARTSDCSFREPERCETVGALLELGTVLTPDDPRGSPRCGRSRLRSVPPAAR